MYFNVFLLTVLLTVFSKKYLALAMHLGNNKYHKDYDFQLEYINSIWPFDDFWFLSDHSSNYTQSCILVNSTAHERYLYNIP